MKEERAPSSTALQSNLIHESTRNITSRSKGLLTLVTSIVSSKRISISLEDFFYAIFRLLTFAGIVKFINYILTFIAQKILDGSKITIKSTFISNCKESSMKMCANMVVRDTGPIPVTVVYTKPLKLGFVYNPLKAASRQSQKSNACLALDRALCKPEKATRANILLEGKNYFGQAEAPRMNLYPFSPNHIGVELNVQIDNECVFSSFAGQLIESDSMVLQLTGDVTILAFGIFPIHNLKLDKSCPVKGMKGLKEMDVKDVFVCDGTEDYLLMKINCSMFNPADMDTDLGNVNFNMYYKGHHAGTVSIPDMKMGSGKNNVVALGFFRPDLRSEMAVKACYELLDRYIAGKDCEIIIKGNHRRGNRISYWATALSALTIPSIIKGKKENLIVNASLVLSPIQLLKKVIGSSAPSILKLSNPFDAPISIYEMQASASMGGTILGSLVEKRYSNPIILSPHRVTVSPQMDLSLVVGRDTLQSIFSSVASQGLHFDCQAKITARVGKYPVTLHYSQEKIPLLLGA
ncbi:hypothetical protein DSO57_1026401 [Entomophthora muscae]|uniref:Uncharacterized protein n=1 Tax=Entomophthora muscae TaxID=34485 RepID=A0ACC2TCZ7_9FUNG|nr:hypothetical protein DSO57_1026401 [Entomophthora muscae]